MSMCYASYQDGPLLCALTTPNCIRHLSKSNGEKNATQDGTKGTLTEQMRHGDDPGEGMERFHKLESDEEERVSGLAADATADRDGDVNEGGEVDGGEPNPNPALRASQIAVRPNSIVVLKIYIMHKG